MGGQSSVQGQKQSNQSRDSLKSKSENPNGARERFEMASDDFTLDREGLKKYFKCRNAECDTIFQFFDMDGNDKIDSYEFLCAISMLSNSSLDEKAELIFDIYDFDKSRFISRDELVILLTNSLSALNSMNKKPAPSIQEIEIKTDEFFKGSDLDKDNKITLQEFKQYIKKDKQILECLFGFNVAKREDIGTDFGGGDIPEHDEDLENEINPPALNDAAKNQAAKEGLEYKVKADSDGLFEEIDMGEGDQFMAVKPWLGVIKNSVPSDYKSFKGEADAPDATLDLEYIYGYRCHDTRNNLRYNSSGNLIYHAAGVGIQLNAKNNTQQFFMNHNDDIMSLAVSPDKTKVATGQIGPKPFLCVWDANTMELIAQWAAPLTKGIMHVSWAPNGTMLAASAQDEEHCVAVFDLTKKDKQGNIAPAIMSGKGTKANILSLGFNPAGNVLVATAMKEVQFFNIGNGPLKGQRGSGWGKVAQQAVLCQAYAGDTLVTGLFDGKILSWSGKNITKHYEAHASSCTALYTKADKGFISGGNDGVVIVWSAGFQKTNQIDIKIKEINSLMPKVRSVCEGDAGKILVGTRGGEIIEFSQPNNKHNVLMKSHFNLELWGLGVHPNKAEFITVGQDQMLSIWDVATRKQLKFAKLDAGAGAIEFSPDAKFLAIGYTNGQLTILDSSTFGIKALKKDRTKAISEIKFNMQNTLLAVGAHDSMIFLYNVTQNFKLLKKLRGHHSTITHLDFSNDGTYLKSNCTSYEILFFDCQTYKQVPSGASNYKDESWFTETCVLGWAQQGIWAPCADGSDINALDRAPDGKVLATADDFGMVKLFKYPCPVEKSAYNKYIGHSSHVTNVRFLKTKPYVISTGGNDKSIFQWKYQFDQEGDEEDEEVKQTTLEEVTDEGDDLFAATDMGEGDQALAVLPFKGEVDNSWPSDFKIDASCGQLPQGGLTLKYVHGYRCFDCRDNIKYTTVPNQIVYHTAAVGIVHNLNQNTQTFHNQHEEDIVAFDISPDRKMCATGEMAVKGKANKYISLYIWDIETKTCIHHIKTKHLRAIKLIKFSPDGSKIISFGEDDDHSCIIYDVKSGAPVSNAKVDRDRIYQAAFKNNDEFVTVGTKSVKFWTIKGQNLTPQKGLLGKIGIQPLISACYTTAGTCLAGTCKGQIVMFTGRNASKALPAHGDAVWSIQSTQQNIISGGNDGKIIFWDQKMAKQREISITGAASFQPGIRSLDINPAGNILVGTRGGDIIEVIGDKPKNVVQAHFNGELWGVAVHPTDPDQFVSCGGDKTIRHWNFNKIVKSSKEFPQDIRAIDWAGDASFIAVGAVNGEVWTINPNTLDIVAKYQSCYFGKPNLWIQDLKISPNSQYLAFGTHGSLSKIEVAKVAKNGASIDKYADINVGMSSALLHLDWDVTSTYIVSNSQGYELFWIDINTKKRVNASSAKDIEWQTWTCKLGFPVQYIWPGVDFTDVNHVCRTANRKYIATAEDSGKVKLFKYPVVCEGASFKDYTAHSSHVTRVMFTADDKYLISGGGNDKAVCIWETDWYDGADDDEDDNNGGQQEESKALINPDDEDFGSDPVVLPSTKDKIKEQAKPQKAPAQAEDDLFEMADVGQGDEFMAVKPWIGQMKPPSDYQKPPKDQEQPPYVGLELEWVHGYRAKDSKNNLSWQSDGTIAYHAAAVGIVQDQGENTQKHFIGHKDDIMSMAFSSDKTLVATGELGPKPSIYIWDTQTMQVKHQLKGKLLKGVTSLAFSPSGDKLAAVAMDTDHHVGVYNVENGALIAMDKGDGNPISGVSFKDDNSFATSGVKHYKHWTINGNAISAKKGLFKGADSRIGAVRHSGGFGLTGVISGEILVWADNSIKQTIKNHTRPVDTIEPTEKYVFTGARDGSISILKAGTFQQICQISIADPKFAVLDPGVNAIAFNESNKLLVGTRGSEILCLDLNTAGGKFAISGNSVVNQGHYTPKKKDNNEVWGLTVFPNKDEYISVGDDATLRVFSCAERKQTQLVNLNKEREGGDLPMDPSTNELSHAAQARSIDISPDSKFACIGFRDGSFRIYDTKTWKYIAKKKVRKEWISDIKFSPNGKLLAIGSHDNFIDIYQIAKNLVKQSTCKGHSSYITHIDWSMDSQALHSTCGAYEILYWKADTGAQEKSGASNYKDEHWFTWNTILGWPVQGIWEPTMDGTDINAVDRSHKALACGYQIVACADDFSKVKLYRYPSMVEGSKAVEGMGHSSHVTNVKFTRNDNWLISTGGNDNCVFQWKINQQ